MRHMIFIDIEKDPLKIFYGSSGFSDASLTAFINLGIRTVKKITNFNVNVFLINFYT